MEKINVIMPVYINDEATLKLTISAIRSLGDVNLVVVDNNSNMGMGIVKQLADTYIKNIDNLGYAKAVNQGLTELSNSSSKLIAVSNNDIRVSPNWQDVTRAILKDENVYSCHLRQTDYNVPFEYGRRIVKTGMERWCTGSFFTINSADGPFLYDENYLNSYDDWDYFYRVREKGLQTAYTDMACYQHKHSHTQQQIPEREENNKANAEYFKQKHGDYAEILFAKEFPEQMERDYLGGFNL